MSTSGWRWVRSLGGAAILMILVAQLGSAPFREALRALDTASLVAGVLIAIATTACVAWRWRLIAERLNIELPMSSAMAAYYRSQFLNVTLPGGVLGDIDRGLHHGREVDDVHRALRAVAWERTSGQAVLAVAALVVLLLLGPFTSVALMLAAGAIVTTAILVVVAGVAHRGRAGPVVRAARVAVSDGRGLLHPRVLLGITLASLAAVTGHVATFVVAARTVGVGMPIVELVPVALVVLVVAAVPLNLAGWGPREGAAAWVFAAAGAQAAQGLAVAVAYGAIVLVAALPGAAVILAGRGRSSAERGSAGHRHWRPGAADTGDAVEATPRG